MNAQPEIKHGYYMHYKNKIYKLMDYALIDKAPERELMVIYQPQYATPGISDNLLWTKPKDAFFTNINLHTPRFQYLGRSEQDVMRAIKENKLNIKPEFKKSSMLSQGIAELVFGNFAIQAFAIHSDTFEPHVIYNRDGNNQLMILPENEFFAMSNIDSNEKSIAKYLNEIKDAEKILK